MVSCVSHDIKPTKDERVILEHALDQMSEEYSNPRLVSGKLIVKVSDIELLSSETLHLHNLSHGIPGSTDPFLGIWSSDIRDYPTQKVLDSKQVFPSPTSIDSSGDDNNNTILYWNVLEEMGNSSSFEISRSFRYLTYDYRPKPDSKMEQQQWHTIPAHIINRYTRSEMFLEQDEALVDTVFSLLETACGPVEQARIIYDWVQSSLSYIYPPEVRGVRNAFETREGDCGQYSALFITMARIAGIPARQQSGFNFFPGKTGAHVWSEIYLPVKGWVPIDATRDDGFLHLDNQ